MKHDHERIPSEESGYSCISLPIRMITTLLRNICLHVTLCYRLAGKLLDYLSRGTKTWVVMFVRLVSFSLLLIPGWYKIIKFWLLDTNVTRNIPYTKEGAVKRNLLDIYTPPNREIVGRPVIIFVSGGAWIIGYKMWSALLARGFSIMGAVVVVPDYRNFPQGNIGDMINDVENCLRWTIDNIEFFGGDKNNINLAGQSAGAHICACTLLKNYRSLHFDRIIEYFQAKTCETNISMVHTQWKDTSVTSRNNPSIEIRVHDEIEKDDVILTESDNRTCSRIEVYNSMETSTTISNSDSNTFSGLNAHEFGMIRSYIGVSGPYNLRSLMAHSHKRGLDASILESICDYQIDNFSPTLIFHEMLRLFEEHKSSQAFSHFPRVLLMHGTEDASIPIHVCEEFFQVLKSGGIDVNLMTYDGLSHTDPILEGPLHGDNRLLFDIMRFISEKVTSKNCYDNNNNNNNNSYNNINNNQNCYHDCQHANEELHKPMVPSLLIFLARKVNPF